MAETRAIDLNLPSVKSIDIEYIDRAPGKKILLLHRSNINGCTNS